MAIKTKTQEKKLPKSTSKEAKKIIRDEIRSYYKPSEYGVRSTLDAVKKDAEAYSAGKGKSNWAKGAALVDGGAFACYYDDQAKMLKKIYGNKVEKWDGEKIHNTYKNLIGREYSSMLSEREKAKLKKAQEKAKAKALKTKVK